MTTSRTPLRIAAEQEMHSPRSAPLHRLRHNALEPRGLALPGSSPAISWRQHLRHLPDGATVPAVIRETHMAMLIGCGALPVVDGPTYAAGASSSIEP